MKFLKNLLKKKWGLWGAVIYPVSAYIITFLLLADGSPGLHPIFEKVLWPLKFTVDLTCEPGLIGFGCGMITLIISAVVFGYILGIIAEKLWRKFK